MDNKDGPRWQELTAALGYVFHDRRLLINACTHRSFTNENPSPSYPDNERLEFLGDAVLQLCVSAALMSSFPDATEGRLSKMRAAVVNEQSLATLGRRLGLGNYLLLGKGEEASGGREKSSLLADALEAVMGAVFLDGGYDRVAGLVEELFAPLIAAGADPHFRDYKSALQEYCQSRFQAVPQYHLQAESGPDHDKTFVVELRLPGETGATGIGKSRKEAEQQAARKAWEYLVAAVEP
ncbi:MAG TPA: ribonuclease III [Syntrophales bacterium]|jgi:ribonuclease III|nr:ribonuclease III [Syntrophales bacterium]HOU77337.1 ribonuclease III [Syntrophales bacterium]HPC32660.1 ribonuclease III [Syntrophales bacterium]HQG33974.1 ribonuclease III [Syntrophales bacterium]HQI35273.1 ribonuclease III [Syntrophales bacterium]